ncbi:AAA family ATPase [Gracilibacillus oryzae]|uniref:AAA family ATPase n=1 Tax=Gracilibacillus oryzae TaxID=1672701 RepID=A0A7C8KUY7_9BACI|nr:AAA family ATPase [Gracilibacillus oryzae]KAB8135715.1 AAA family ATPase [Gracilibacillus oryzae]
MEKRLPIVIAIAAVSGGGKTTITSKLKDKLQNSQALYFDDYDFAGPEDIMEWIDNGGNPDEWDLSPLIRDIKNIRNEPLEYLILDFPFAYLHTKTSDFIDYAVFIDTPLDIALARRIRRDFKSSSTEIILKDLETYIVRGRQGYLNMLETTKPNSDLVVDGTLPINEIVNVITKNIARKDN